MEPVSPGPGQDFDEVVRAVVVRVAPDEEPMVEDLRALGHDGALNALKRGRSGDGLGFGWPELVEYLTPAFYIALDQSLRSVLDVSIQEGAKGLARRLFGRRKKATIPAMSDEERNRLRDDVLARLITQGVPLEKARQAADELVAVLETRDEAR